MLKNIFYGLIFVFIISIFATPVMAATNFNLTDGITNPLDISSHYNKISEGIYTPKVTKSYNNGVYVNSTSLPTYVTDYYAIDAEMNRYAITGTGYVVKISPDQKIVWATDIKDFLCAKESDQEYIGDDSDGNSLYKDINEYYSYYNSLRHAYNFSNLFPLYFYNGHISIVKTLHTTGTSTAGHFSYLIIDCSTGAITFRSQEVWMEVNPGDIYYLNNYLIVNDFYTRDSFKVDFVNNPSGRIKLTEDTSVVGRATIHNKPIFNSNSILSMDFGAQSENRNAYFEYDGENLKNLFSTNGIVYLNIGGEKYKNSAYFKDINNNLITRMLVEYNDNEYVYNGIPGMNGVTRKLATDDLLDPFYLAEISKGEYIRAYIKDDKLIVKWFDDKLNTIKQKQFATNLFTQTQLSRLETDIYEYGYFSWEYDGFWTNNKFFLNDKSFISTSSLDFNTYYYGIQPTLNSQQYQYIVGDNTNITLKGTVKDNNNANGLCTVEANINGVIKTLSTTEEYTINFDSLEIGEGKYEISISVSDTEEMLTTSKIGTVDIEYPLTDFNKQLNMLGKSGLSRISILDTNNRVIDSNSVNQNLINSIADKLNGKNIGLYVIDGGNEILKNLAAKIN